MKIGDFDVKHGDRVYFRRANGSRASGKVNGLLVFPGHVVLDMGGRYGRPEVVPVGMVESVKASSGAGYGQADLLAAAGVA